MKFIGRLLIYEKLGIIYKIVMGVERLPLLFIIVGWLFILDIDCCD